MQETGKKGALDGIRVLDLTRILAGPYCTLLLGDLGAEIIKIEVPGHGDDSRAYPPFVGTESAYFMNLNRNKRSLTLNLKVPEGKKILLDLVKVSDVLIENFRPGTLEDLGLGYDSLKAINPGLVQSSISGFGHTGPYKNLPGYDIIGQALGGIMSVTGWPDGPPSRTGTAIGDILAGLCSCIGILSSLIAVRDGRPGQKVDIALVDSVVSAMEAVIEIYLVEGRIPQRTGNRYEFIYPYDTFRTKDGWVVIAVGNDKLWATLCRAINNDCLLEDPKYGSNRERVRAHEDVKRIVEAWTETRTVREAVDQLSAHAIPCAPMYTVKDVVEDAHIAGARRMVREVEHPTAGRTRLVGSPINLSETPSEIRSPAPLLGQHSAEILAGVLHYSKEQIETLRRDHVI
jgi:crotonobetainyl-CoA:carnitine CoA-transferase CaiB-like acyl-CoA transferase